ncbi:MAG: DUF3277 family protein [Treponema sp.]|jgi:hypothetical protein|nr:DUF3277 family protein [Treponema sp.]
MAGQVVSNYDPKKVILTFGGVPITGFTEGTFIGIAANDSDAFKKKVGADGEVGRAQSNDNTHNVTITLMQSSASNDYLSNIFNADRLSGTQMLPLSITDLNGKSLRSWPQAWIKGDPNWDFAKELSDRQWVLDTGQAATNVNGGLIP